MCYTICRQKNEHRLTKEEFDMFFGLWRLYTPLPQEEEIDRVANIIQKRHGYKYKPKKHASDKYVRNKFIKFIKTNNLEKEWNSVISKCRPCP